MPEHCGMYGTPCMRALAHPEERRKQMSHELQTHSRGSGHSSNHEGERRSSVSLIGVGK